MYIYPFSPTISKHGTIDPSSIHPQKYEVALTLFTTALASFSLYRTTPIKITILGTAAVGIISHLFWTKLGHWAPNKVADEKCIRAFLNMSVIDAGLAKRVLNNDTLHDAIFNKLVAEKNGDQLLSHYFAGLWSHIPLQERRGVYLKTLEKMTNKKLTDFHPSKIDQFYMWTTLTVPDLATAQLLALNFESDVTNLEGHTPREHFEHKLIRYNPYYAPNADPGAEAARSLHSLLLLSSSPLAIYERGSETGRAILRSYNTTVKELLLAYVKPD
jgi:hypothetical protein